MTTIIILLSYLALLMPSLAWGQTDPGVRSFAGTSWPLLPYIDQIFAARATDGRAVFNGEWSMLGQAGTLTKFAGLGPRFNALACATCHAAPVAIGGSPAANGQIAQATEYGASNTIPSFLTSSTAAVAPFVINNQTVGSRFFAANSLAPMFTVTGRSDAPGCTVPAQPYSSLSGNIALHQAPPLWGLGLVETVSMANIGAAQLANAGSRATGLGITLSVYNSGVIDLKGAKVSLQVQSDFAGSHEFGLTTRTYPRKQDEIAGCVFTPLPEDDNALTVWQNTFNPHSWHLSQMDLATDFIRASSPPVPACVPASGSSATCYTSSTVGTVTAGQVFIGQQQFVTAGCDVCHTPTLTAGPSSMGSLVNGQTFNLFSDLALHGMGTNGDGLTLGGAGPAQMRTSPLWGLGYRIDFWSDGRTKDLGAAIALHSSTGSEANATVTNYNALSSTLKQDILDFLRSL